MTPSDNPKHYLLDRLNSLGKDTLLYGLGSALSGLVAFLFLIVITRILKPGELGFIELIRTIQESSGALISMGLQTGICYFFYHAEKEGGSQSDFISSILQWIIVWGTLLCVCIVILLQILNGTVFENRLSHVYYLVIALWTLSNVIMAKASILFRLLHQPVQYICFTVLHIFFSGLIAVALILKIMDPILGFITAYAVVTVVFAFYGWVCHRRYVSWNQMHWDLWPRLIKFSAPYLPVALLHFTLVSMDRWFIVFYKGEAAVGIYSVGARICSMIVLIVTTFILAWEPVAMEALNHDHGKKLFRTVFRIYMQTGLILTSLMAIFSPHIIHLLFAPDYHASAKVVSLLSWYPFFYGFFSILQVGIWKSKKTIAIPMIYAITALINFGLNILWVPHYGFVGASCATSAAFLIFCILNLIVCEKLWKVDYPWKFFSFLLVFVLGMNAVIYYFNFIQPDYRMTAVVGLITVGSLLFLLKRDLKKIA